MSVRLKHEIAYAASILSLFLLQIACGGKLLSVLSDFHFEIAYSLLSQLLCMGAIPLFTLLLLKRKEGVRANFEYMRYKKPTDLRVCLLASLGLMLLITPFTMVFNALTTMILKIIGFKRGLTVGAIYGGAGDLWLYILIGAVLPAIFEEFTHRGVLLSGLENKGSEYSAVVLSAVCFGLMHANPSQFLYAVVGGLVFGAAVTKTGSMIPAMCAHFANNFVATMIDYGLQKKNAFGVLYQKLTSSTDVFAFAALVGVLALSVFGVIYILQYLARKTEKPVSEKKLFGVLVMDAYRPDGKATLKDNAVLIATMIAQSVLLATLVVWGIFR